MTVHIQTVRFDADSKLIDHVNKKIEKLGNYHDRIVKVDVFLKLDNVVHQIKDKIAEIRVKVPRHEFFVKQTFRVKVPRHEFFVKQTSKSFEESFDNALDSLITQIKRTKEKQAA